MSDPGLGGDGFPAPVRPLAPSRPSGARPTGVVRRGVLHRLGSGRLVGRDLTDQVGDGRAVGGHLLRADVDAGLAHQQPRGLCAARAGPR